MIFEKHIPILNLMKIRPVEAELFHADRQTGMTKVTVAPHYLPNPPNVKTERIRMFHVLLHRYETWLLTMEQHRLGVLRRESRMMRILIICVTQQILFG